MNDLEQKANVSEQKAIGLERQSNALEQKANDPEQKANGLEEKSNDREQKSKQKTNHKLVFLVLIGFAVVVMGAYTDISRLMKNIRHNKIEIALEVKQQAEKSKMSQVLLHMSRIVSAQDDYYFSHRSLAKSVDELGFIENANRGCIIHADTWDARDSNDKSKADYRIAVRPCVQSDGNVSSNGCFIVAYASGDKQTNTPMYLMMLSPIKNVHSFKLDWEVFALKQPDKINSWHELLLGKSPIEEQGYRKLSDADGVRYKNLNAVLR